MKQIFHLTHRVARQRAADAVMDAPEGYRVEIRERTRSLDQNALMWSVLSDLSRQVQWPVNGQLTRMTPDQWKDVITASLSQENKIAQGIRGGFVMLGKSTSRMTIREMTEVIEFALSFGTEHDVKWSPTSLGRDL